MAIVVSPPTQWGATQVERLGRWLLSLRPADLAALHVLVQSAPRGIVADWIEDHAQPRRWAMALRSAPAALQVSAPAGDSV